MFDGHRSCGSRDMTYLICHLTLPDRVIKGSCDFMLYGRNLLIVCNHPTKFGCRSHCYRDVTYFIPHMIWQDHVNKEYCDFILTLLFSGIRPCGSRGVRDLIFHMTLQDHAIKGPWEFMEERSSLYILILPSLVAIGTVVVEIYFWFVHDVTRPRDYVVM